MDCLLNRKIWKIFKTMEMCKNYRDLVIVGLITTCSVKRYDFLKRITKWFGNLLFNGD